MGLPRSKSRKVTLLFTYAHSALRLSGRAVEWRQKKARARALKPGERPLAVHSSALCRALVVDKRDKRERAPGPH